MPFYNDMNYYGLNSLSYTPYYSSSNVYSPFSGYSRALTGGYVPPSRTAYSSANYNRHYKPKLKPISETPFHTAIRSQALTALTRINSPKAVVVATPTKYVPPRPILINTANIDVSSSRFDRHRKTRGRSESPEPVVSTYDDAGETEDAAPITSCTAEPVNEAKPTATDEDPFMPRVDQHDPPQFRSTIKRNRNIVRLSTNRLRSNTSSRNDSSKRNSTNSNSSDDRDRLSQGKESETKSSTGDVKKSWRDRFGDSLQYQPQKDVVRKTPGELILEKHIIRDKRKDDALPAAVQQQPREPFRMPEIVIPSEFTHTEAQRRKSVRRQSLAKCPSFKEICQDISSDLRKDDDLNAGELRRRASLILEQEQHILAQLNSSRRPSAEIVNVDAPIVEADEEVADSSQKVDTPSTLNAQQLQQQLQEHLLTKRKSKKKSVKKKPTFTVSVDVENGIVPLLGTSDSIELMTPTSPKTPNWKAIVNDADVEHTVNKVFRLPSKKVGKKSASTVASVDETAHKLKKSESGEDFWGAIGRRESFYFQKDRRPLAVIDDCAECAPTDESSSMSKSSPAEQSATIEAKSSVTNDATMEPIPVRRNSLAIVKSNSENDLPVSVKPKLKPAKKKLETNDAAATVEVKKVVKRKIVPNKLPILHEVQTNEPIKPIVKTNNRLKLSASMLSQQESIDANIVASSGSSVVTNATATAISSTTDSMKTICSVTTNSVVATTTTTSSNNSNAIAIQMDATPEKSKTDVSAASKLKRADSLKIASVPLAKTPEATKSKSNESAEAGDVTATIVPTISTASVDAATKDGVNAATTAPNATLQSNKKPSALAVLSAKKKSDSGSTDGTSIAQTTTTSSTATTITRTTTTTTTTKTTTTTTVKKKSDATAKVKTTTTEVTATATTSAQHKVQGKVESATVATSAASGENATAAAASAAKVAKTLAKTKTATAAAVATASASTTTTTSTVNATAAAPRSCANEHVLEQAITVLSSAEAAASSDSSSIQNKRGDTELYALSKFPTVNNLSNDLSFVANKPSEIVIDDNESCISGEETFDCLLSSESEEDFTDSEYSDSGDQNTDEMGLKRRHRKKRKDQFDPKRMVKLDHTRKCYVVEETPKYPLIATPRPLQKKYHYYSESETDTDEQDSENSADEYEYEEYLSPNDGIIKDVIRMSTCSNDSGFEGGGTAPASPKKMLGKHPNGGLCVCQLLFCACVCEDLSLYCNPQRLTFFSLWMLGHDLTFFGEKKHANWKSI